MGTVSALDARVPIDEHAPAVAVVAGDRVVQRRAISALAQDGQVVLIQPRA